MIVQFPDGRKGNIDESRLKPGDVISGWEYKGNSTKPGNPLWNEWQNIKTGETTLKIYYPQDVITDQEHYYEYVDMNGNYQCRNCPIGGKLIFAYNQIKDGKIIKIASNQ